MAINKRALITNFGGLGNGIMVLPILKCMENSEPRLEYFHTWNPILSSQEFTNSVAIKNLRGLVPSKWRRFNRADWDEICEYIQRFEINLIINMRNEGPEFDLDYYEFKNIAPCKTTFWELNYAEIQNRESHKLLVEDILTMLNQRGIKVSDYDPHWLGHYFASQGYQKESSFTVGFYTGASQNNKRWAKDNWIQLGDLILDNSNCKIEIHSGLSDDEVQLSTEIAFFLQNRHSIDRCYMVAETKIFELARRFYTFDLLVSNDTFATHLGSALGIPVIGIYFSTDSSIWGGNSKYFVPVQSRLALNCPMRKHHAGNCRLYYDECLSQCKNHGDIAAERVWDVIRNNRFVEYNS